MLGGIEVFVYSMSGRLGKGKEEGVAPSSSGLSDTDQEGGVSNSLFPSSSHSSSVGASGKLSADRVREKEEKVRKCLKEISEKLDLLSFQSFDLDERLWEADLAWESVQPGKDKKEKKGEVGKLKAEIAELEEQVERLEKMKGNMLKWARGERLGPKRNLTGPSQSMPSLSTSPGGVSSGSSLFFVPQSTVSSSSGQPPMEVTVKAELKIVMEREKMVRDVPNFRFKRVTKISVLLSIHNFQLKMATHEIGECKQKAFLMDVVAPSVACYLEVFGLESHSVEELLGCVKRRLLGAEWKNKVLLEWERMQQSEGEKVWIFRGRVQMFLNALGFDPSSNASNGERCRAEVLPKLLPLLRAEAEQSYNLTALSWEGLWERLERVEESYGLEVRRAMAKFDKGKGRRGNGGTCPLPPEAESEGGRGRGGGEGQGGKQGPGNWQHFTSCKFLFTRPLFPVWVARPHSGQVYSCRGNEA